MTMEGNSEDSIILLKVVWALSLTSNLVQNELKEILTIGKKASKLEATKMTLPYLVALGI